MIVMFEDKKFKKVSENLYLFEHKYYRLFGYDISDNYCWVINPVMVETDIKSLNNSLSLAVKNPYSW